MKNKALIPDCTQLVLDDVGWFCGYDDRACGGPSRTGMPRRHCADDYKAIEYLGELLDMKINCAFVIGEWDPDNRLRKIPHLSKFGSNWNNAAYVNEDEVRQCVEVINASPYIDVAVHGLLHGYYQSGTDNYDCSDYYYRINRELFMVPEEEVRLRLDSFFELCRYYGIRKPLNSFVPPSFNYRWNELSRILKDYGIDYVSTIFKTMETEQPKEFADVENGIITVDRKHNMIPFYAYDCNYEALPPVGGIFGAHWPNILHFESEKYPDVVRRAAAYFKRCGEVFGIILSRDMRFCASHSLYKRYAKVRFEGDVMHIDLTEVPTAKGRADKFYISAASAPKAWTGCDCSEFEHHDGFCNYEITPHENMITITF